ncbi:dihydropyrimidine dehydrogenase (NADP(+)), chloroplastic-like isoform X2 [Populus trichocarpa]|uniref:dihydropyrimidine dehydrogenase (NADP(+)), chloroplastic-like isoform X2 n=1 Tax=Populus trichocarpa TaxID=3694 RepID=UPI0022779785|nr:dihydropyrimidine dehydrogenase (NADP(+)), chloroplastic-like isoform X2 [Populus trichocarpa]
MASLCLTHIRGRNSVTELTRPSLRTQRGRSKVGFFRLVGSLGQGEPDLSVTVNGLQEERNERVMLCGCSLDHIYTHIFSGGWSSDDGSGIISMLMFKIQVSLDAAKVVNVTPRYAQLRAGANGSAKGQIIGWENIELEYDKAAWEELIDRVEQTGIDALEINFSCPHGMPERKMGAAVGQDCALLEEPARVALLSLCEGVSAINTIMSVMGINLKTLRPEPCVEGYSTPGGYSSKSVHPIALEKVMSIAKMMKSEFDLDQHSLSGIGVVETGGDAAEFILLGANTVQVCTGVMMHGYGLVKKLCEELKDFMKMHNFSSIEDFRGASLEYFTTHMDLVRRQQEAMQQRKAIKTGLQSDKDWTGDGFVKESESMVSN